MSSYKVCGFTKIKISISMQYAIFQLAPQVFIIFPVVCICHNVFETNIQGNRQTSFESFVLFPRLEQDWNSLDKANCAKGIES